MPAAVQADDGQQAHACMHSSPMQALADAQGREVPHSAGRGQGPAAPAARLRLWACPLPLKPLAPCDVLQALVESPELLHHLVLFACTMPPPEVKTLFECLAMPLPCTTFTIGARALSVQHAAPLLAMVVTSHSLPLL